MCSFGSCKTRFEFLSQFRKVRNAFECFVTRLAYEDKRDLYCSRPANFCIVNFEGIFCSKQFDRWNYMTIWYFL